MSPAAPKQVAKYFRKVNGKSTVRNFVNATFMSCAAVCVAMFFVSPALAQRGSHGGGSHGGGGHASASHGGGSHSGGAHVGGTSSGGAARVAPAPAHMSVSRGAGSSHGSSFSGSARVDLTSAAGSSSTSFAGTGFAGAGFVSPRATEDSVPERSGHTIFISGPGRMTNVPLENASVGQETFAARNHLWQAPPSPANAPRQAQQQGQHPTVAPPAPVRPVPMPVAPAGPRPVQMPGPVMTPPAVMTPPVAMPPVMTPPMMRIPVMPGAPPPTTPPRPTMGRGLVMPGPAMRGPLPGAPRARIGRAFGAAVAAPLPVPPKFGRIALEPGLRGTPAFMASSSATGFQARPSPAQFCVTSLPNCGIGFGLNNGGFGFGGPPLLFFAFGGPFGFGGPCLFDEFFLNCFSTGWNGPFGWGWTTPWGYDPAGTGLMFPIAGGYYSPTPAEQNEASVNSIGPTTFLAPQPEQLMLAPSGEQAQPVAYLVMKDGIEFGVTKYWVEDNRICYVTTYNVQSCISLDQLDLQATVDINYKRGITFTLTPKPESPQQPQSPDSQPPQP